MTWNNRTGQPSFRRTPIGLTAALCLGAIVCCASAPAAEGDQAEGQQQLDICDQVEDELLLDTAVTSHTIDVYCIDGVVTLDGTVDNLRAQERARKLAQAVRGVRSVVNRIRIMPDVTRTDSEILADIGEALLNDPATDSYEVRTDVSDGHVTLTGTVDSWQERDLAAAVAKGVRGVTGLTNEIDVDYDTTRADTTRADSEVKQEIEQALKFSVLLDPASVITVDVRGGDVTLTGTVGSAAEKTRAESLAWVAGVKSVTSTALDVVDRADDPARRNATFPTVSDAEIKLAVKDALLFDPRTNMFNVDVSVLNGYVTLRGTVDNLKAKRSAEQDARNTVGVISVNNRLKVRMDGPPTDADIKNRIESALIRDPVTDSFEITPTVNNGIVTLEGTVDSYYEKSQADDVASRVAGVAWVDNNLLVNSTYAPYVYDPYVDGYDPYSYDWYDYDPTYTFKTDAEIKEDINDELFWSPFVDANQVTVTVNNGKATLTGQVDSWAERQAAAENAIEGGATSVENLLTIDFSG